VIVIAQRNTLQKRIILDALQKLENHPTVEEVCAEVRSAYPTISKNTAYRNLRLFAENGEIRRVPLSGGAERYDKNTHQHYHFQCKVCGLVLDVEIDYLGDIDKVANQKNGLKIDEHEIVFRGICPRCREASDNKVVRT